MKALVAQTRVEFTLFLRDKAVLFFSLSLPLMSVVFFAYLNRGSQVGTASYSSFLIAGGIGMVLSSAAFENLSTMLARQRDTGVLKRVGGTPMRAWTLIAAKTLTAASITLVQTILLTVATVLLFDAEISGSIFWSLVTVLVGVLNFTTMGIALSGLCRNADVASAAGMAISLPMQFLCGTLFPLGEMPPLLQHIAGALPLTYFVDALRGAMLHSSGPLDNILNWAVLLGCLMVGSVIAVKTFRWE